MLAFNRIRACFFAWNICLPFSERLMYLIISDNDYLDSFDIPSVPEYDVILLHFTASSLSSMVRLIFPFFQDYISTLQLRPIWW